MPQSSIEQVVFTESRFVGDPPPFFEGVSTAVDTETLINLVGVDSFSAFLYAVEVPSDPPNPDRISVEAVITSQQGVDDDGIVFNGNYRLDRDRIEVFPLNLSAVEKAAALGGFSVVEGTLTSIGGGQKSKTDQYTLETFGLTVLGVSELGFLLPYTERDIDVPGNTITVPFIRVFSDATSPRDPTLISYDSVTKILLFDDGSEIQDLESLVISNAVPINDPREIVEITVQSTGNVDIGGTGIATIQVIENTTNQVVLDLSVDPSIFPAPFQNTEGNWIQFNYKMNGYQYNDTGIGGLDAGSGDPFFQIITMSCTNLDVMTSYPNSAADSASAGNRRIARFFAPPGADITLTNDLSTFGADSIQYILSGNEAARTISDGFLLQTGYASPITVDIDAGSTRILITGTDDFGSSVEINISLIDITMDELRISLNNELRLQNGWRDVIFCEFGSIFTSVEEQEYYASIPAKFLSPINRQLSSPESMLFSLVFPQRGVNSLSTGAIDFRDSTLRLLADVTSFFVGLANTLYPGQDNSDVIFSDVDFFGLPDEFIDTVGSLKQLGVIRESDASPLPSGIIEYDIQVLDWRWPFSLPGFLVATQYERGALIKPDGTKEPYLGTVFQDFIDYAVDLQITANVNTMGEFAGYLNDNLEGVIATVPDEYLSIPILPTLEPTITFTWEIHGIIEPSFRNLFGQIRRGKFQIVPGRAFFGSNIEFTAVDSAFSIQYTIANLTTMQDFASQINGDFFGTVEATVVNDTGAADATRLGVLTPTIIGGPNAVQDSVSFPTTVSVPITTQYDINNFTTLDSLVAQINLDWNGRDIFAQVSPGITGVNARPDAVPANMISVLTDPPQDLSSTDFFLLGDVSELEPPIPPEELIYISYSLDWIGDDPTQIDEQGIQVAFGGYSKDGEFFFNQAPNAFFEPGFNSLFDVTFSATEADNLYVLVRTRQDANATAFTSDASDYQALVRFSNGFPSQTGNISQFTGPPYDVWADAVWNSGNIPAVYVVSAESNIMTLIIDDINVLDSITVRLTNFPEELDEFAFLALNRTNLNNSMTESQQGTSFGLVLDNRGIWDVLVGPEAEIQRVLDGGFDYLTFSFNHEPIDSDEAYNFEIQNLVDLPAEVSGAIEIIPVPGFPKVAVLRVEAGVKRYLQAQRALAPVGSLAGCSVDIDILATGRESQADGVARITIFADYTCVFDIGLCDFFWNLSEPKQPDPPDAIANNLEISYTDYIDCTRLDVGSDGDNLRIDIPILVTIKKVPMFENGNALLLVKAQYSDSIEGFFFPTKADFGVIQNPNCSEITNNEPLSERLNQRILYTDIDQPPITDLDRINEIIFETTEPYMLISPKFQFPGIDNEFECGPNEIVIVGIGYQFRDWSAGERQDDVLVGANSIISNSTFSAPEIEFCYKYYYRREA